MEKRVIGMMLTILGIIGLLLCAYNFVNHGDSEYNRRLIVAFAILGVVFFGAGLGIIKATQDVIKKDEHVS